MEDPSALVRLVDAVGEGFDKILTPRRLFQVAPLASGKGMSAKKHSLTGR